MRARKLLCTVYLRDSIMRHVADGSVDLLYVDAVAFVFGRAMLDLPWAAAYRHAKTGVPRGSR
jgi:hypothetical protein